jgi:hypothetical protein
MAKVVTLTALDTVLATKTDSVVKTGWLSDISVVVVYTRVSGAGAGTLVFYGSTDSAAATTYKLGVRPFLTGSLDADASIDYTTSATVCYNIDGVHPFINLQWTETSDPASITAYIVGYER